MSVVLVEEPSSESVLIPKGHGPKRDFTIHLGGGAFERVPDPEREDQDLVHISLIKRGLSAGDTIQFEGDDFVAARKITRWDLITRWCARFSIPVPRGVPVIIYP